MNTGARLSAGWVYAALVAHVLGFLLFWPRVFLVVDEERYVSQAVAFAAGRTATSGDDVSSPMSQATMVSDYPPGTSLLQTPFVWALGWRGAGLLSVIALIVATLATMKWLSRSGKPPAFALLVPGFLGSAFFGRIGMSDVPSTALVAVTSYLVFTSAGNRARSLGAGFAGGAGLLFREPLLILLAPLLAGAVLRRVTVAWALIAGFVLGCVLRLALMQLFFDSPFYVRDPTYGFSLASLSHTIPVYAFILMVLFPLGIALPFLYRGTYRAELVIATALYLAMFLTFEYDVVRDNGLIKGVMLASRYMAPMTPILAFMTADAWPRLEQKLPPRVTMVAARAGAAGAALIAFAVHPLAARQEIVSGRIVQAMQAHTAERVPVVTNTHATLKYLSPSYGNRRLVQRYGIDGDSIAALRTHYGPLTIALLDRRDSEMFRRESDENAAFLADVQRRCQLTPKYETKFDAWAELRILDVAACR